MKKVLVCIMCFMLTFAPASVALADESSSSVIAVESFGVGEYALLPDTLLPIVDGIYDAYRWGIVVAYGAVDGIVDMDYMDWAEWRLSAGLSLPTLHYSADFSFVSLSVTTADGLLWRMAYEDGKYVIDVESMAALAREFMPFVYNGKLGVWWPRYSVRELYDAGLLTTQQFTTLFSYTRSHWETRPNETIFFARMDDGSGAVIVDDTGNALSDSLAVSAFRQSGDADGVIFNGDGYYEFRRVGSFQLTDSGWKALGYTYRVDLQPNGTIGSRYADWYWRVALYSDLRPFTSDNRSTLLLCPYDMQTDNIGDYIYLWKTNDSLAGNYGAESDARYILGWDQLRTPFSVTLDSVSWITDDSYYYHIENIKKAIDLGKSADEIRVSTITYYSAYDGEDDGSITDPDGTGPDDISPPDNYPDYGGSGSDDPLKDFLNQLQNNGVKETFNSLFDGLEGFWDWLPLDIGEIIQNGIWLIISIRVLYVILGR